MRRTSMLVIGLIMLVLALAVAGCGGGGSKESAATTEAATTEAAVTDEATTEAATTQAAETTATETTEAEATTTAPDLSALSSAKCRELAESAAGLSSAFTGAAGDFDVKKAAAFYQELAKKVPSEIRADFQVIADFVSKYAEVAGNLKPGETPDPAMIAKLQKLATEIDQAKLTQASQNISAWVQKGCKS